MDRIDKAFLQIWCCLATCALLALHLSASLVLADAAPPWTAQGAAVAPGQEPTQVQMVSEEVTLTIEPLDMAAEEGYADVYKLMVAHVEATFLMHNSGEEAEAFDVWFPLTTGGGYGHNAPYPSQAENFRAWVNGEPTSVEEAPGRDLLGFRDDVPWAKWPVTFPAGQDVELRVTYDAYPVGWGPWGTFHYILETGAGWHGPIGSGTVTFRLPYEATPMNAQVTEIRETYAGPGRSFQITVDGTDVVWHFTDLEPRGLEHGEVFSPSPERDNALLSVLAPAAWAEIEAARAAAEQQPDSVEAQLRLARALEAATQRRKSFSASEANAVLIERTDAAYQRAIELEPQDVEVLIPYLEWLAIPRWHKEGGETLGEGLETVLRRALELAPDDPRVLQIEQRVGRWREYMATATAATVARPTSSPAPTKIPSPTPTTMPSPTATRTPSPSPTTVPTSTPAPTPTPNSTTTGGVCPGAFALAGLLVVLWLSRR